MPTFIDESGCCGFDVNSKPYFRLVAVWFPTSEAADSCRETIELHRKERKLPERYEFKFSTRMPDAARLAFFTAVAQSEFRFVAAHFDKLAQPGSVNKEGLFRACISVLADTLHSHYQLAEEDKCRAKGSAVRLAEKIIPDDNEDALYLRVIKDIFFALKAANGKSLVGGVKPGRSKSDRLLQLADMVCGAVGAHLCGESDYFNMISQNILRIAQLPETKPADGEGTTRRV